MREKYSKTLVVLTVVFFAFSAAAVALAEKGPSANSGSGGSSNSGEKVFEKNLGKGVKEADVADLQKKLNEKGFFNAPATGFFGNITEQAVKEFQRANGLPETGFVGPLTREALNREAAVEQSVVAQPTMPSANVAAIEKQIEDLRVKISQLQDELQVKIAALAEAQGVTPDIQAKAGIVITGGVSGPGYPTGPLNIVLPATQLLFDKLGQVKGGEVKGRQYEIPVDDVVPPIGSPVPVTVNGVANTAGIKVISSLKTKNGVGQHQGTIDVDIDTIPAGHVQLAYNGTATVVGSTITSKGTFKTAKVTGIFTGLVAEGTYEMTIIEPGTAFGSPVTVSITTVSP